MDIEKMKNMIVLKDLPSNIIEEAFIVLKKDVKVHKYDVSNSNKKDKSVKKELKDSKNFAVKEAELILREYVEKIELNKNEKNIKNEEKYSKKYEKLKALTIFLGVFCFILIWLNLIK